MVEEVQVQVAVEQEAIHILYQVLQEPMAWAEAQAEAAGQDLLEELAETELYF